MTVMPAEGLFSLMWLLIALPLASAAILLFTGRRSNSLGPYLGVLSVCASAVLGVLLLIEMMGLPTEERAITQVAYQWVFVGNFTVDLAFQLDQLSIVFILLITIVGSLIHIYSLGYMSHDPDKRKFFGYLNLFVAAMLLLVMANNYLLLYVGWEGVGLASYLLIGFWQHKRTAAAAAKKAFIINRIGDVGLSLAIMLMFVTFGSVTFSDVFGSATQASEGTLTAIGLLLLLAAAGKSAQFPLQAWLLDAMEGPTPVSALIHAATMVTAGVYLIARSNVIYNNAEWAAMAVIVVALITIFMGAIIGSAKDDIKKALAGSTMSQIGYMMLAVGLGPIGYVFAIFHLVTHGVNGFTVERGDAATQTYYELSRKLCDGAEGAALRRKLGRAGRAVAVARYDLRANSLEMVAHYQERAALATRLAPGGVPLSAKLLAALSELVLLGFFLGATAINKTLALAFFLLGLRR